MNRPYIEKLLQLMQDNPTLKVLCKVDSGIVAKRWIRLVVGRT